jgi:sortase (surface protein transpeptidase)
MVIIASAPVLLGASTATATAPLGLPVREVRAPAGPPPTKWLDAVQVANPQLVRIPRLDIAAQVMPLHLNPDRSLEVPKDFNVAGWYADGPEPGEPGASVIVGHVDSYRGPAVFFRLGQLLPGDEVMVEAADHTLWKFVVERVGRYPKAQFPTNEVYGVTPTPTLRLITCGGMFDRWARSYRDNIIVFAHLIDTHR